MYDPDAKRALRDMINRAEQRIANRRGKRYIKSYMQDPNSWFKPVVSDLQPPLVGEQIFIHFPADEDSGDGCGYLVIVTKVVERENGRYAIHHNLWRKNDHGIV